MDTNKRVIMAVGCSRDTYTTWAGPIEYLQQKLNLPDLQNVNEMLIQHGQALLSIFSKNSTFQT